MKYAGQLAIFTVFLSANTTCNWFAYQPVVPKELNQFKRIK
jgi:cyclic lactone autoinducer peptide